jgi:hypothetical protein
MPLITMVSCHKINKFSLCEVKLNENLYDVSFLLENDISYGYDIFCFGGIIKFELVEIEKRGVKWIPKYNMKIDDNHPVKYYNYDENLLNYYSVVHFKNYFSIQNKPMSWLSNSGLDVIKFNFFDFDYENHIYYCRIYAIASLKN